jgi:hypothetical protein
LEALFPGGEPRDFHREAVVETHTALPEAILSPGDNEAPPGRCRIVEDRRERVVIEAELAAPGLLVLADLYDDDWKAVVRTEGAAGERPAEALRTNRIFRGVVLPPARHRVTFSHRPRWFWLGAGVSLLGWAGVVIAAACLWKSAPKAQHAQSECVKSSV